MTMRRNEKKDNVKVEEDQRGSNSCLSQSPDGSGKRQRHPILVTPERVTSATANKTAQQQQAVVLSSDQKTYLQHIQLRSGSYGVLLGLYCTSEPFLTKHELCHPDGIANCFCDGKLREYDDPHHLTNGNYTGSWSSVKKTLETKELVERSKGGLFGAKRKKGDSLEDAFRLTNAGKCFVKTLLTKRDNLKAKQVLRSLSHTKDVNVETRKSLLALKDVCGTGTKKTTQKTTLFSCWNKKS